MVEVSQSMAALIDHTTDLFHVNSLPHLHNILFIHSLNTLLGNNMGNRARKLKRLAY
jgi:hypothetical protein